MKLCFCKRSAAKTLAELILRAERLGRAFRLRHTFSKLSWRNFERLTRIVKRLGATDELTKLFRRDLDVNRMLIYLEKSGSSVQQFKNCMDDILTSNKFSKTITLSGGKTMKISEFINEYTGVSIYYYYKKQGGNHFFLKYDAATQQAVEIVVDANLKVLVGAESKVITDLTETHIEDLLEYLNQKTDE
jgi:hypothetical protein